MNNRDSLVEATILALQGKLKLEENKTAKKESVDVSVDDYGNTVVDTEEATVVVSDKQDTTVVPEEDTEVVEIPVDSDETIIPEEEIVSDEPVIDEPTDEIIPEEELEESKKVRTENVEIDVDTENGSVEVTTNEGEEVEVIDETPTEEPESVELGDEPTEEVIEEPEEIEESKDKQCSIKYKPDSNKLQEGVEYKGEITSFDELYETSWSGAIDTLNTVREHNAEDALMDYLEIIFDASELPTRTEINDILWFMEDSEINEICGIVDDEDLDESKKVEATSDLEPRFDSRASFYGKAKVDTGDNDDENKLYSYGTLVAEIKNGKPVVYGTYSQTTLRHIKDWLQQNGFEAVSKSQIERDYMEESKKISECKTNKSAKKRNLTEGKTGYEPGICPNCGAYISNFEPVEWYDDSVGYPFHCDNCGADGEEYYNLSYEETVINDLEESKKVTERKTIKKEAINEDVYKSSNLFKALCDEVEDIVCEDDVQPSKEQIEKAVDIVINGYDYVWEDLHIALRDEIDKVMQEKTESKKVENKFSSKSFNTALTEHFKKMNKGIKSCVVEKVSVSNNLLKIEGKLINADDFEKGIYLEMKKVQEGKSFIKYELKEAKGIKTESKSTVRMMTFKGNDNTLECKYIVNK